MLKKFCQQINNSYFCASKAHKGYPSIKELTNIIMTIRNLHVYEVASLRDACDMLIISHRTALRLYGVIKNKPLRGFFYGKCG